MLQTSGSLEGHILGNYLLKHQIARGGFADVYESEHVNLKTLAAIKVLHTPLSQSDKESFCKEARTVARLNHQHIVRIQDFGFTDDMPYMVMQYATEGSIRSKYARTMQLTLKLIILYTREAASALYYAHNCSVIHRDVKPENMLLEKDQGLLLCDFGLSVVIQSSSYRTVLEALNTAGTPCYMAPEQFKNAPCSASDQYSLGVTVYEWLCGTPPFQGNFYQLAFQHENVQPSLLWEKEPGVSRELGEVVHRALAKDPKQRFPNVQEFANAFERAAQNAVVPSSDQPGSKREEEISTVISYSQPQPTRRHFLMFGMAGLGGLAGGLIGGGGTYLVFPPKGVIATPTSPILSTSTLPPSAQTPSSSPTPVASGPLQPRLIVTYKGHTGEVAAVAFSPDGKRIASGARDRFVQVWDATIGNPIYIYRGHKDWVFSVMWSLTGQRVASSSSDDTVQIWDAATGGNILPYKGHRAAVVGMSWSPDGRRIASGSVDKTVQVWDAGSGVLFFSYKGHADEVDAVCYSPDGKYIASGGVDQTVQIWDALKGTQTFTYNNHTAAIDTVKWSPNGKYIASGGVDQTVQVWDITNGRTVTTYQGHSNRVRAVAWSPDGTLIASASADASVQIWNAMTGVLLFTYQHSNWVHGVVWSPDGTLIASASADKTVQVWRIK